MNYEIKNRAFDKTIELTDSAMLKHKPDLFDEWDFEKNDELGLDVYTITKGSNKKAWWTGKCGHSWEAVVASRPKNGCPICNGKIVLKGFNDIWTTNPQLASQLENPNDGYKSTQMSGKRVNWRCLDCGQVIKNKPIKEIKRRGLSCPVCSDGVSIPERIMCQILESLTINYKMEKSFKWSNGKRYDFYIPSYKMIIEMHGMQHYSAGFEKLNGSTVEDIQNNDLLKKHMAIQNGIDMYIVIDCRSSEIEFIRKNIINSELNEIFDLTNIAWEKINTQRSSHYKALELWNMGLTIREISEITKFHHNTLPKILKRFESQGKCKYDPERWRKKDFNKKKIAVIYQFDSNYNLIKRWNSIDELLKEMPIAKRKTIGNSCRENRTAYGFMWKYERDVVGWSVPINR